MSPMPPDDILKMAGLLAPQSKAAAGMAVAPNQVQIPMALPAEKVGPNGYVTGMPPPEIMAMVASGVQIVGGREARMAMFPDEFPESKTDKPNVVMRGIRGIAAGIADMAPSTMALAAGVIDFMGADEAGAALGQKSLDLASLLNDHLAVENPNLFDHAARGFGSMVTFLGPGILTAWKAGSLALKLGMVARDAAGVAKLTAEGAQILSKTGQAFRALTGGGAMSFLESAVEQSQREMELIGKGMTPEQALKESAPVFWHNMGVLMATNTVAYFLPLPIKTKNEFIRRAAKAVEAAFTEGGQERAQAVIQDVASGRGEWGDFLDPQKNVTDTLVGAIVGGGTAAALPGEPEAVQGAPAAPVANAPDQTPQQSPKPATPQQAPAQAAQPAQPSSPAAAPAAPAPPVPEGMPMEPVEGWEVWTGQDEDEDPGLTRTPAEMEAEQVAAVEAPSAPAAEPIPEPVNAPAEPEISPEAPAPLRKVASEAKRRRAAERKAAAAAEAAAVNAEAARRMEAAKPVEPVAKEDDDTRGGGVQYHGSPTPIGKLYDDTYSPDNIYGQGLYTTESAQTARGYSRRKKSRDGRVYEVVPKRNLEIFDMDADLSQTDAAHLDDLGSQSDFVADAIDDAKTVPGPLTLAKIIDSMREISSQLGYTKNDVQEFIGGIQDELHRIGYDGMTHVGGKFHGNKHNHKVVIYFRPADSVDIREVSGSIKRAPAQNVKNTTPVTEAKQEAPAAAASGIVSMPTSALTVSKPGEFQKRENIDNEESQTNEAKMQAIMADFKPERLTPIVAWRDPVDGKLKVLDGHHTIEAAKRAGITNVNVREFTGTREEATTEAEILNDLRTANDPLSRAATVRRRRAAGMSEADIEAEARPRYQEATPTVLQLSFLNPNGQLVAAIRQFMGSDQDSDSTSDLMKMAKWIGEARRRNPNLTDAHEQEMFDALRDNFGKAPWAKNAQVFTKHVRGLATAGGFDANSRLNLGLDKRTPAEKQFDADVAAAQAAVDAAESKLAEKEAQFAAAGVDLDTRDKILKPFRDEVSIAKTDLAALDGSRERYLEAERNQGGLFRLGRPSIASLNKSAAGYGLSPAVAQQPRDLMDEIVVRVAKMFGFKNVQFVSGLTTKDGRMAHGYYQGKSNSLFLNVGSPEPMLTVTGHEVAHRMEVEHPDLYGELVKILNDPANVRVGGKEVYAKDAKARGYSEVGIEREWVADGLMEAWSRPEFWNVLQEKNPTLAGKLINMIVDAMSAIRRMFAASGASVDIYYNNFGPLVRQIANVAAQMQAREAAGAPRLAVDPAQIELFRIAPIGNSLANEMRDRQSAAMKKNGLHRHQGWKAGWRHVYMTMLDKHTFTYWKESQVEQAEGKKIPLSKRPYIALRRFQSWMTQVQINLEHEVRGIDNQTVLSPGVVPIIRDNGIAADIDSREFGLYYTAATLVSRKYSLQRRGKDFFGKDPESAEYQAAAEGFAKWQKIYDDYHKAHPEWEKATDDFTSYIYALNRRALEANVIDQQEFDNLTKTYSVFAPLTVIGSSEYNVDRGDPVGAGVFAHDMTVFDPTAVFMDPVDALIKRTYAVEYMIRKTQAAQSHANFIRAHKDKSLKGVTALPGFGMRVKPKTDPVAKRVEDLLKAAGTSEENIKKIGEEKLADLEAEARIWVTSQRQPDGVIALLRGSKVEYWQLDPDIYESFMAAVGPKAMHPMMKFFSAQTSLLRAGAVLTPDFMARNQFRDFASAAIISQHLIRNPVDPFLLPVRILRGLSAAIGKTEAFKEFMLEVGHAQLHAQDQNGIRKTSKEATRTASGRFNYVLHSNPITILQEFGKLTENSTRYAVYWKTKNDLLKMKWSESEARVKAAMEARESSIDFSRSGTYGQVINQIIPFFNAAVQGNDKTFRTFVVDDGGRGAAWLKATMLVTIPSILLWALNHDEEWYKDQPIWLKNNFWLFSFDGGKTIHKLPKPFEIGLMHASLPERFLDWSVDKDPKAMKEWSEAVLKNVVAINDKNPLVSGAALLGPSMSTMIEIGTNYDPYRGTPIVKGWLEEVVPREQYNANTSEFAKALGGMAPGRGISPMMIDHFIRGTFGGLGAYAAQAASEVIMLARPELKAMKPSPKQIRTLVGFEVPDWIPVIRAFAQASPAGYTRQMNDFFEIYDRGRESSKTLQAFKAAGATRDKFISLYRRSGPEIATFKASQEVAEKLGEISKRARFIESLPSEQMSREEKRKQVDQLTETRNLMVKKFLDRYYEIDQKELQRQIEASIPQLERAYGR